MRLFRNRSTEITTKCDWKKNWQTRRSRVCQNIPPYFDVFCEQVVYWSATRWNGIYLFMRWKSKFLRWCHLNFCPPLDHKEQPIKCVYSSANCKNRLVSRSWSILKRVELALLRRPGIEPGSTAWKAAMLTTIPIPMYTYFWMCKELTYIRIVYNRSNVLVSGCPSLLIPTWWSLHVSNV